MKSGLEGRNNQIRKEFDLRLDEIVSMKSGLEGRNNTRPDPTRT